MKDDRYLEKRSYVQAKARAKRHLLKSALAEVLIEILRHDGRTRFVASAKFPGESSYDDKNAQEDPSEDLVVLINSVIERALKMGMEEFRANGFGTVGVAIERTDDRVEHVSTLVKDHYLPF